MLDLEPSCRACGSYYGIYYGPSDIFACLACGAATVAIWRWRSWSRVRTTLRRLLAKLFLEA